MAAKFVVENPSPRLAYLLAKLVELDERGFDWLMVCDPDTGHVRITDEQQADEVALLLHRVSGEVAALGTYHDAI